MKEKTEPLDQDQEGAPINVVTTTPNGHHSSDNMPSPFSGPHGSPHGGPLPKMPPLPLPPPLLNLEFLKVNQLFSNVHRNKHTYIIPPSLSVLEIGVFLNQVHFKLENKSSFEQGKISSFSSIRECQKSSANKKADKRYLKILK